MAAHPPAGTKKSGPHGEVLVADGHGGWKPATDHSKEKQAHIEDEHHKHH